MYRRNELGKAFILIGDKSNGKSTFLHVVKNLLGDQNIASLDLKELGDSSKPLNCSASWRTSVMILVMNLLPMLPCSRSWSRVIG